jgi:tetratricopeptide (TPR) repeat protein
MIVNDLLIKGVEQYELALEQYNAAVRSYPKSARGFMLRGLLLFKMQRFSDALKDFNIIYRTKSVILYLNLFVMNSN